MHEANCFNFTVSFFTRLQKKISKVAQTRQVKKRGRSSLLPGDLMEKTISMVEALRLKGVPVTAAFINSVAKGVIAANDRSILIEGGGYLSLKEKWGLMCCIVWRRKTRKCVDERQRQKKFLLLQVF